MNGKPITVGDENSLFDKLPNHDNNNFVVETVYLELPTIFLVNVCQKYLLNFQLEGI
jgi:hypothetical protein